MILPFSYSSVNGQCPSKETGQQQIEKTGSVPCR